jgi:hypothetical protein
VLGTLNWTVASAASDGEVVAETYAVDGVFAVTVA